MANKKIVVLKLRELIYTGIFLFFGIILIVLLVAMFSGGKSDKRAENSPSSDTGSGEEQEAAETFCPGIYTADFTLADNTFTLQLLVDADRVKAVDLLALQPTTDGTTGEDFIATMYPLMEPALDIIESSLAEGIPLSEITFSVENQYTGSLLVQAIDDLLAKARMPQD